MLSSSKRTIAELAISPAAVEGLAKQADKIRRNQYIYKYSSIAWAVLTVALGLMLLLSYPFRQPDLPAHTKNPSHLTSSSGFLVSIDASPQHATKRESVTWSINLRNTSHLALTEDIYLPIDDINKYAHVSDISDGGFVTNDDKYITWPDINLDPRGSLELSFKSSIDNPLTFSPINEGSSDNCQISTTLNDTKTVQLACPIGKSIALSLEKLPIIRLELIALASLVILIINLVALTSLNLKAKELKIIRKRLNSGAI